MTNKVAKDYITMLLGWSRKKEKVMTVNDAGERVESPASELQKDEGFGK